jgi:FKBP-type peptidyl-prolyl cis-trans isomerase
MFNRLTFSFIYRISFVLAGFDVKVVTDDRYVKAESGLIYLDLIEGEGKTPSDGQQVVFHYTGYNENGRRVDSSYQQGQPARTRLGIKGMIPGKSFLLFCYIVLC